jgi:hypothetical protein
MPLFETAVFVFILGALFAAAWWKLRLMRAATIKDVPGAAYPGPPAAPAVVEQPANPVPAKHDEGLSVDVPEAATSGDDPLSGLGLEDVQPIVPATAPIETLDDILKPEPKAEAQPEAQPQPAKRSYTKRVVKRDHRKKGSYEKNVVLGTKCDKCDFVATKPVGLAAHQRARHGRKAVA